VNAAGAKEKRGVQTVGKSFQEGQVVSNYKVRPTEIKTGLRKQQKVGYNVAGEDPMSRKIGRVKFFKNAKRAIRAP